MRIKETSRTKKPLKKRDKPGFFVKKRYCRFCTEKIDTVDYKDIKRLEHFIRDRGKIVSTRSSGNCAKHQRMVTEAIKKARFISLLPYSRV